MGADDGDRDVIGQEWGQMRNGDRNVIGRGGERSDAV